MYAAAETQIFIYVFSTLPCYLKENNHALLFIFIVDDSSLGVTKFLFSLYNVDLVDQLKIIETMLRSTPFV